MRQKKKKKEPCEYNIFFFQRYIFSHIQPLVNTNLTARKTFSEKIIYLPKTLISLFVVLEIFDEFNPNLPNIFSWEELTFSQYYAMFLYPVLFSP